MCKKSFLIGLVIALPFIIWGTLRREPESLANTTPQPIIQAIAPVEPSVIIKKEIDEDMEEAVVTSYIRRYNHKVSKKDMHAIYEVIKSSHLKYLLIGVMRRESAFDKTAYSKKKDGTVLAVGLCGINLENVQELKDNGIIKSYKDLYKISENIKASEYFLKQYIILAEGDVIKALKMYWIGPINFTHPKYDDATYPEDVLSSVGHIRIKMEIAVSKKEQELAFNEEQ